MLVRTLAAAAIAAFIATPTLAAPPSPQGEHARWKADHAQWSRDVARAREAARTLETLAAETERMIADHETAIARHEAPTSKPPVAVDGAAPDQGVATRVAAPAKAEDHAIARSSHEAQRRRHARLMEAVKRVEQLPAER